MNRTRAAIPVVFFAAILIASAVYGFYSLGTFLFLLVSKKTVSWPHFFTAEFFLLLTWRFLSWFFIALAIRTGKISNQQVRIKNGTIGRAIFLLVTGVALVLFPTLNFFTNLPDWYSQLGNSIAAVSLFCTFTYP
jgi:hypothetical protein